MGFEIQKAGFWKRAAAFMLDIILQGILIVGLLYLLSAVTGYDQTTDRMQVKYDEYNTKYDTNLNMSEEEYNALPKEKQEAYMEAYEAFIRDEEAVSLYRRAMRLSLLNLSAAILAACLTLEFMVPLLLKEGRTLGKKVFGLCVVHTNCVRMEPGAMFIRTLLGKYTIETMVPVLILLLLYYNVIGIAGTAILLVLALAQVILLIATQNNQVIHDMLAQSTVADYQSQPIYDTLEELNAAKAKKAAEAARMSVY